jgi:dTDP-4-dehydrorhamnose 3,5-epimerase
VKATPLAIPDVRLIEPARFTDNRGYFSEIYRRDLLADAGIEIEFIQDNESRSEKIGTVRGLHFQAPPYAQAKLVRVTVGKVFDVAVDIRAGSPTFGQCVSTELGAENGKQLYIPVGFAHGFCALENDTVVAYKASAYYAPAHDLGLCWNDPDLAIPWPVDPADVILSERDGAHPRLKSISTPFE